MPLPHRPSCREVAWPTGLGPVIFGATRRPTRHPRGRPPTPPRPAATCHRVPRDGWFARTGAHGGIRTPDRLIRSPGPVQGCRFAQFVLMPSPLGGSTDVNSRVSPMPTSGMSLVPAPHTAGVWCPRPLWPGPPARWRRRWNGIVGRAPGGLHRPHSTGSVDRASEGCGRVAIARRGVRLGMRRGVRSDDDSNAQVSCPARRVRERDTTDVRFRA